MQTIQIGSPTRTSCLVAQGSSSMIKVMLASLTVASFALVDVADGKSVTPALGRAVLKPRLIDGFPSISMPFATGIASPVARRINLVLDRDRQAAMDAAEQCRVVANRQPSSYTRKTNVTFNRNGLLSLHFTGDAQCGGAHGSILAGARTFDLSNGVEIDVAKVTGLALPALGRLAASGYRGNAGCRTFLVNRAGSKDVTARAAYLVPGGIGVLYDFNVGAAGSCGADPAIVPVTKRFWLHGLAR